MYNVNDELFTKSNARGVIEDTHATGVLFHAPSSVTVSPCPDEKAETLKSIVHETHDIAIDVLQEAYIIGSFLLGIGEPPEKEEEGTPLCCRDELHHTRKAMIILKEQLVRIASLLGL